MILVVQGNNLDKTALSRLTAARSAVEISPAAVHLSGIHNTEAIEAELAAYCKEAQLDWAWVPENLSLHHFGLFVTDMDSTLINIECIDEIADMQGLKSEVAEITEAAMRGEIDFRTSLSRRVALLAGLPEAALEEVYSKRLRLNPGAETLLDGLRQAGIRTMLISGGFTYFTDRLKQLLKFDYAYANTLESSNGILTGNVLPPIIDAQAKADYLVRIRTELGLNADQVIAVGDGANDALMLDAAGMSIAYHAKPVLHPHADACIHYSGLSAILNLFGPG